MTRTILALALLGSAIAAPRSATAWKIDPGLAQACPALVKAKDAAKKTVDDSIGVDCFLHGPLDMGMDPEKFNDDDEGPEIKSRDLSAWSAVGLFSPRTPNCIYVDEQLKLDAEAGDLASQMLLEATIVHETSHWVDWKDHRYTPGIEGGNEMEEWIYGFIKEIENAMTATACAKSPAGTLAVRIATPRAMVRGADPIDISVTLTNVSNRSTSLLGNLGLDAGLLLFTIRRGDGTLVPYVGDRIRVRATEENLHVLPPGASFSGTVRLNAPEQGYEALAEPGTYKIAATYKGGNFGCPLFGREDLFVGSSTSNSLNLMVRSADVLPIDPRSSE